MARKIKFITAIASILLSVGYVVAQIKAFDRLFYHFLGFPVFMQYCLRPFLGFPAFNFLYTLYYGRD